MRTTSIILLIAIAAAVASASRRWPAVINISETITSSVGMRIAPSKKPEVGDQPYLGMGTAQIGDINADGVNDWAVGSMWALPEGRLYIIFGRADLWTNPPNLDSLDGTNGFEFISTISGEEMGFAATGTHCDLNKDGVDDLVIGAHWGVNTYVVFGQKKTQWQHPLYDANVTNPMGFKMTGWGDLWGFYLTCVDGNLLTGDWSIDSSRGRAALVFAKSTPWNDTVDATNLGNGGVTFALDTGYPGVEIGEAFGSADLDNDGYLDLLIGGQYGEPGYLWVIWGRERSAWPTHIQLPPRNLTVGFEIYGQDPSNGRFSSGVWGMKDFNGDGIMDVAIGDCFNGVLPGYTGKGYILFGKNGRPWELSFCADQIVNKSWGLETEPGPSGSAFGRDVAVGDFDHDGLTDIAFADAYYATVHVVYGTTSATSPVPIGTIIAGPVDSYASQRLASLYNVDGREITHLLFGAPRLDNSNGSAYLIKGSACITNDCSACVYGYEPSAGDCVACSLGSWGDGLLPCRACATFDAITGKCLTCADGFSVRQGACSDLSASSLSSPMVVAVLILSAIALLF